MKLHLITFLLLVIGGLNWLLQGALGWDVSRFLGGMASPASRAVYIIIGLAAVVELISHKKNGCKECDSMKKA